VPRPTRPHLAAPLVHLGGASDWYRELTPHGGILCTFATHGMTGRNPSPYGNAADHPVNPHTDSPSVTTLERRGVLLTNRADDGHDIERHHRGRVLHRTHPDLSRITVPLLSAGNWAAPACTSGTSGIPGAGCLPEVAGGCTSKSTGPITTRLRRYLHVNYSPLPQGLNTMLGPMPPVQFFRCCRRTHLPPQPDVRPSRTIGPYVSSRRHLRTLTLRCRPRRTSRSTNSARASRSRSNHCSGLRDQRKPASAKLFVSIDIDAADMFVCFELHPRRRRVDVPGRDRPAYPVSRLAACSHAGSIRQVDTGPTGHAHD